MSFQDAFPELQSAPPTRSGQIPMAQTLLTALRRQQLVDLARAYDIPILPGATKNEMLPAMIAQEQQGIFRTPPKRPWYLQKAQQTTDTPHIPMPENPDLQKVIPKVKKAFPGSERKERFEELRQLAKKNGINTYKMKLADLEAALEGVES